ncbi:restriction endonuclease [uncultured Ruminococcus sp.]|uniref:restriction endonuclease n=1 Tax=uncultured Ruminococcus sp. TaxID=165186 RepID=UPI0025D89C25|nr:restriction endonuclease [uncultured Ruminococcus sp.]MDD6689741.1 restriction endonuclease [Clostridium sp.]
MTAIPNYATLIEATFSALKMLGGSGKNDEINSKVAEILELSNEVQDIPHLNSSSLSEVNYRCAWARTILKNYGALENSARSVWTIKPEFTGIDSVDGAIVEKFRNIKSEKTQKFNTAEEKMEEQGVDVPEEVKPWRKRLYEVLINMDPYGFERLTQRVLRECGFTNVVVTKKSGDGGIDGTGKLKINGIFSFNIAFQCKRYQGSVGAGDIRDFRGSLTTDIEKGVFITTGSFSKPAIEEASNPGKQQIDLIDGEEFITKLAEFGIGVKEVKDYEIDEQFFAKI